MGHSILTQEDWIFVGCRFCAISAKFTGRRHDPKRRMSSRHTYNTYFSASPQHSLKKETTDLVYLSNSRRAPRFKHWQGKCSRLPAYPIRHLILSTIIYSFQQPLGRTLSGPAAIFLDSLVCFSNMLLPKSLWQENDTRGLRPTKYLSAKSVRVGTILALDEKTWST